MQEAPALLRKRGNEFRRSRTATGLHCGSGCETVTQQRIVASTHHGGPGALSQVRLQ
jgi:hypothetical protein